MAVTSTTLAGVNVWQFSGAVTDAEIKTAWASLIVNNRYKPGRTIYIDSTCSLVNVRGTYYVDAENLGVILHLSRNKANTLFSNWFFTQTVGLAVAARSNFVRFTNGTTITNSTVDGIDMKGGGMMYAVTGNPGGGDPRYLNEMMFGSLDGTLVTSAAFTEQEIEPTSIGTVWKGLNVQKAAGYPILSGATGIQRQVIYRSAFNTEGATLRLVRPYYNNSLCYVSSTVRRQGAAVTANLADTFGSSGAAVIMALNNYTDESWFGASKTAMTAANWSAGNRFIGGVMKKIQVQPSTVIRTYDSRSTTTSQKSTFSETTSDFLTGSGTSNLLLQSESIDNAAWEKGLITVTADNTTAPDGTTTADKLVETTGTGQHRTSNVTAIGVTPATAHTFSFYAKPGGRNHVHARIISGGSATDAQACFNLVDGTFLASAGTTATATSVGNGWYRCTLSATLTNNTAIGYVNLAGSSSLTVPSYAGNATLGVFLWGMQLQAGSTATTYLKTTTSRADGYYTTVADSSTGRAQFVCVGAIATGSGINITRYTDQKYTLQKFGYQVQVISPDMTFGDDDLSAYAPITMTAQSGISRTESAINSATTITTYQELLEELHVLALAQEGAASYNGYNNGNLFSFTGGVLTTNFASVTVDATAASKISYNSTTNALTIKSSVLASNSTVTQWNNASGSITLANGAVIQGVYSSSAGTSTTFQFQEVEVGSSLIIYDASGTTKYFQQEVTTAGTYSYYIPPGVTGTYYWAIEKYGTKRESGSFAANTGGLLFYVPAYAEDVGITQATKATVAAYTALETNSKVYDYVAYKRLSESFIKIGQITTRSGTSIEWIAGYDVKIKATNASVFSLTGTTFYIKSSSLAGDTKYTTNILVPPATMAADTTEVITTEIEDGNGDSSVTVEASSVSTFEVWKITDATDPDDYATGTLVDTIGIGKWRFLHADGYKFVIRDTTTNYRVVVEAEKGIYMAQLFFGAAVQLAQAAEVSVINTKVDIMQIDLDAIKGTGFVKDKHSLTNIKKKAALAAALSA